MPFSSDRVPLYGCIFCKTGCELETVNQLSEAIHTVGFIVPQKIIRRRTKAGMIEEKEILFPGYVFFQSTDDVPLVTIMQNKNVLRVLNATKNDWMLLGEDALFAKWVFDHNGLFGLSEAHYVGDRIRITSGPLMGRDGQILKVNRRFKTCQVSICFDHREFKIWLGYELIEEERLWKVN